MQTAQSQLFPQKDNQFFLITFITVFVFCLFAAAIMGCVILFNNRNSKKGEVAAAGFKAVGNRIFDPQGREFIIKGTSSHYSTFMAHDDDGGYGNIQYKRTDKDFDKMKLLGINTVRIFVSSSIYNESNYVSSTVSQDYLNKLKDVIAKARARGFVVLITNSYANYDKAMDFVKYLATTYNNDPYIWMTPMNEWRCANRPDGSLTFKDSDCENWTLWQTEHNEYIKTIRAAGFKSPILVNSIAYSWDLTQIDKYKLTDPENNIIYGAHRYGNNNLTMMDTRTDTGMSGVEESIQKWARFADRYAIIVDEVGGDNGSNLQNNLEWAKGFIEFARKWTLGENDTYQAIYSKYGANYKEVRGNGVILYTWQWSDLNSATKLYEDYDYNDGPFLNEDIVLTSWGKYFIDEFVNKVPSFRSTSVTTPTPTPISTPTPTTTPVVNIIKNPGFESVLDSSNWYGKSSKIRLVQSPLYSGKNTLEVSSRSASWAGPEQVVPISSLIRSSSYYTEAWVRTKTKTANIQVTLMLEAASTTYVTLTSSATVSASGWTKISGTVPVSWSGTLKSAKLYIETKSGNVDFYVDNVSFIKK